MPSQSKSTAEKGHDKQREENSLFPPISSPCKNSVSSQQSAEYGSQLDVRYDRSKESSDISKTNSNSRNSSPCKLPSLSNGINLTSSNVVHEKSNERKSRDTKKKRPLCRSPSCPSTLGFRPVTTDLESPTPGDMRVLNKTPLQSENTFDFKLPSIFRNTNDISTDNYSHWKGKERNKAKGLRRTESTRETYVGSPTLEAKVNKNQPRSHTHAALLLPIRNSETRISLKGKKKKGMFSRQNTSNTDVPSKNQEETTVGAWTTDYDSDYFENCAQRSASSFDKILEETESHISIPSAGGSHISVPSASKQWLKQKEGQVKA